MIVRSVRPPGEHSKHPVALCSPAGAPFGAPASALLFPSFRTVRVKSITKLADERFALTLKGAPLKALSAGSVIVSDSVYRGREGYGVSAGGLRAGRYAPSGGLYRGCPLPGAVEIERVSGSFRAICSAELPLVPGGRYELKAPGEKSAVFLLVVPGSVPRAMRGRLASELEALGEPPDRLDIFRAILEVRGWVDTGSRFPRREALGMVPLGDSLVVEPGFLDKLSAELLRQARASAGSTIPEIAVRMGAEGVLVRAAAEELARRGELRLSRGALMPGSGRVPLSPMERQTLADLKEAGPRGRPRASVRSRAERELFGRCERMDLVVALGDRFLDGEVFRSLAARMIEGRPAGELLSLEEVKRSTSLAGKEAAAAARLLEMRGSLRRENRRWRVVGHASRTP